MSGAKQIAVCRLVWPSGCRVQFFFFCEKHIFIIFNMEYSFIYCNFFSDLKKIELNIFLQCALRDTIFYLLCVVFFCAPTKLLLAHLPAATDRLEIAIAGDDVNAGPGK